MSWKILKKEYLEKNKWVNLRKDVCITTHGKKIDDYYVMELADVASVVAITKDKKILLVKEYKHGVQKEVLQLPSGYVDKGETSLETAQRELLEETGYKAEKWTTLGKLTGSPGRLTHYYHLFLAENAEYVQEPHADETESLVLITVPFKDVVQLIRFQQSDLVTPAGLLLAKELLERRKK